MPRFIRLPAGVAGGLAYCLALLVLHAVVRNQEPMAPEEAHRALLRLRGTLALAAAIWCGRYALLPHSRSGRVWWLFPPALAAIIVRLWPWQWPMSALAAIRAALILLLPICLIEETVAVLGQAAAAGAAEGARARTLAALAVRRQALRLAFAAAAAMAAGLYLLAIDYIYDTLVYGLLGALLAATIHLAVLAVLGAGLEKAAAHLAAGIAEREEAALACPDLEALSALEAARRAWARMRRVGAIWWDWLGFLAATALPLLASFFF